MAQTDLITFLGYIMTIFLALKRKYLLNLPKIRWRMFIDLTNELFFLSTLVQLIIIMIQSS